MDTGAALDEGAPYWKGGPADPPFTLLLGDHPIDVPDVETGWWINTLARGDWGAVARLLDEDLALSAALTADDMDDVDEGDLHRMACQVAETVAGCPWPLAVRLAGALCAAEWIEFESYCVRNTTVDPHTDPLRRVLAAFYALVLESAKDDAEARKLRAQYRDANGTNAPPPPHTGDKTDKGAPQVPGSKYQTFTPEEAAAAFAAASNETLTAQPGSEG